MGVVDAIEWACILCGHRIQMTEWVEQWIHIKFYIKLQHYSAEIIWLIQKAAAMGNWWSAASSRQIACSCITSHAGFFDKTSNHPDDSALLSPDLAPRDFWLFPNLKSPLKGKRFQAVNEFQGNMMCSWWQLGELCEVPRCLLWRGPRRHCPMYNVSCILCLLQ